MDAVARLTIFRLVPTASRKHRRHARDAFHGEVVVRACSPDDARRVASEAESESPGGEDSLFRDPDCYTVIEAPGVDFLRAGKREVIAGRLVKPVAG